MLSQSRKMQARSTDIQYHALYRKLPTKSLRDILATCLDDPRWIQPSRANQFQRKAPQNWRIHSRCLQHHHVCCDNFGLKQRRVSQDWVQAKGYAIDLIWVGSSQLNKRDKKFSSWASILQRKRPHNRFQTWINHRHWWKQAHNQHFRAKVRSLIWCRQRINRVTYRKNHHFFAGHHLDLPRSYLCPPD